MTFQFYWISISILWLIAIHHDIFSNLSRQHLHCHHHRHHNHQHLINYYHRHHHLYHRLNTIVTSIIDRRKSYMLIMRFFSRWWTWCSWAQLVDSEWWSCYQYWGKDVDQRKAWGKSRGLDKCTLLIGSWWSYLFVSLFVYWFVGLFAFHFSLSLFVCVSFVIVYFCWFVILLESSCFCLFNCLSACFSLSLFSLFVCQR